MDKTYLYRVAGDGELYRVQIRNKKPDDNSYEWLNRSGYWEFRGSCSWILSDGPLIIETKLERKARLFAARHVLKELAERKPGKPFKFDSSNELYDKGAEKYQWMSEGYLYPLFGKDEARSILGTMRWLASLVGMENIDDVL